MNTAIGGMLTLVLVGLSREGEREAGEWRLDGLITFLVALIEMLFEEGRR